MKILLTILLVFLVIAVGIITKLFIDLSESFARLSAAEIENNDMINKACNILRQLHVFDNLSEEEGVSAAAMEDMFIQTMKSEEIQTK